MLLLIAAPLLASGCSSETRDKTKDAVNSAKDDASKGADKVEARTAAEAIRTSLKGNDTANAKGVRSVEAINKAVKDLPGDPTVAGVDDGNGDGLDDDGKVQVTVNDAQACLSLPETGEDTKVTSGAC